MILKFQFPGAPVEAPSISRTTQQTLPTVEVSEYSAEALRSVSDQGVTIEVEAEDVFEFVMEDDSSWYMRADELAEKLQRRQRARGQRPEEVIPIPSQFESQDVARGLSSAVKQKLMRRYTNWAARESAHIIAEIMESKLQTGLHTVSKDFQLSAPPEFLTKATAPYLLLLHGTGSSILGAFKSFTEDKSDIWEQLYDYYEGRVLGFEHKTWSESPVRNALQLLESLPDEIVVDLLTHSRGGLIGEVLVRLSGDATLNESHKTALGEEPKLLEEIEALHQLLQRKKLSIRNFVRVACPAGGTTLLSKRLDVWLNVMLNSLRLIPGMKGNPIYEFLSDFIKAVVHERTKPETLPGLASMRSESPLVKFLNQAETRSDSALYVVSGDAKAGKLWPKVAAIVGDLFFLQEHDLVVPVSSMRMGTPRERIREFFSAGTDVNHFRYFTNYDSRKAIFNALATAQATDFRELPAPEVQTRKVKVSPPFIPGKPSIFLLPGIMGSHLRQGNRRLWVDYAQIATGGLRHLNISAPNIHPDGLHDPSYAELAAFLIAKTYNVLPFAYDWRRDLRESARKLAQEVQKHIDNHPEPVFFIAHSMGGVLLRIMFSLHPEIWEALLKRDKFRVLLLGVPTAGSFAVPRVLLGQDSLVQMIALLDLFHNRQTLVGQFAHYPGLLQLLPRERPAVVAFMDYLKKRALPSPSKNSLQYWEEVQQLLGNDNWDPAVFKYIAGKDTRTPNGIRTSNDTIEFSATPDGDGRVTWASIPPALQESTYYVEATHGDIPSHKKAFEGYVQLLEAGETDLLSKRKPLSRTVMVEDWMPEEDFVEYPTIADIDGVIGGKKPTSSLQAAQTSVKVTLTHGDLAHARFPVMAGHFKGDAILYAEAALDKHLGNRLSVRYELGLYANEIGENIIILPRKGFFKGGIVIGLGNFGELTEGSLTKSLRSALINYLLYLSECDPQGARTAPVGISALLIGSGFGSLLIANVVKAIFNAVLEVNKQVTAQTTHKLALISDVEIIELYRYKAIQCYRLIKQLTSDRKYRAFELIPSIRKVAGRKDGVPDEVNADWWHRIKISLANESAQAGKAGRPITFTSITDRSRAEEKTLDTNRAVVDSMVREAARFSGANPKLSKALFELLVPNEFKTYTAGLRHMVLIVDKETSRYPWELMSSAEKGEDGPIAVKAGLLRQLSTSTFRSRIESAGGMRALVVGDPELDGKYPQLPGAKEEAKNVCAILNDHGYEVSPHIGTRSMNAIVDLLAQPYSILHFAAHGISKDPESSQTGIVMGADMILTPSIFKQMRYVPDMVVVNCCSLGQINRLQESYLQAKYEVAASVGCQLIDMGVKAVILAGWEVEDHAAKRFSEILYEQMLGGETFGNAVLSARIITYEEYPGSNTWGAYQCYGDPFFKLSKKRPKLLESAWIIADAEEAVTILDNFNNGLDTSYKRPEQKEEVIRRIRNLEEKVSAFSSDARVMERIAEAYSKAGDLQAAIQRYQSLFGSEKALFSVRAIEQLQNISVRYLEVAFRDKAMDQSVIIETLTQSIESLEMLNRRQPTAERLSLIGSAYKRGFLLLKSVEYLQACESYYRQAYLQHINSNQGTLHFYPFFNWATAQTLLRLIAPGMAPDRYPSGEEITQATEHAQTLDKTEPDFWNKTALSMVYIWQLIATDKVKELDKYQALLAGNFEQAWMIEGNYNNLQSHLDQFRFAITALELAGTSALNRKKIHILQTTMQIIQQKAW